MFLSLSFSLPSPLSKNKILKRKRRRRRRSWTVQGTTLPSMLENLDCCPKTHWKPRSPRAKTLPFLGSYDAFGSRNSTWMSTSPTLNFKISFLRVPGLQFKLCGSGEPNENVPFPHLNLTLSHQTGAAPNTTCSLREQLQSSKSDVACEITRKPLLRRSLSPGSCHQVYQGLNLREQSHGQIPSPWTVWILFEPEQRRILADQG